MNRVLITGASSGLGLALAKKYHQNGWQVVACGRDEAKMTSVFAHIMHGSSAEDNNHDGNSRLQIKCFNTDHRQQVIDSAIDDSPYDLLILNAGTCEYIDDAKHFDSQLFERVMHTNVLGTGYCLEAYLPLIKTGGQLAIVSSTVTLLPLTRSQAYGASKSALDYLTRSLAIDLAQHQIDVTLIRPGFIDTPLTQKNDFDMPGMIDSQRAADNIHSGLEKRQLEINFPRHFYIVMWCLSCLPRRMWHWLGQKLARKSK